MPPNCRCTFGDNFCFINLVVFILRFYLIISALIFFVSRFLLQIHCQHSSFYYVIYLVEQNAINKSFVTLNYTAVHPPSRTREIPVIWFPAGEQRKRTALPISSGRTNCFEGCFSLKSSIAASSLEMFNSFAFLSI